MTYEQGQLVIELLQWVRDCGQTIVVLLVILAVATVARLFKW